MYYDRQTRKPTFHVGDRVFIFAPSAKSGSAYKFALPNKGLYRVVEISDNVAWLRLISRPNSDTIRVSINRLRHCPAERAPEVNAENGYAPEDQPVASEGRETGVSGGTDLAEDIAHTEPCEPREAVPNDAEQTSQWTSRLRRCTKKNINVVMTRTSLNKDGEM